MGATSSGAELRCGRRPLSGAAPKGRPATSCTRGETAAGLMEAAQGPMISEGSTRGGQRAGANRAEAATFEGYRQLRHRWSSGGAQTTGAGQRGSGVRSVSFGKPEGLNREPSGWIMVVMPDRIEFKALAEAFRHEHSTCAGFPTVPQVRFRGAKNRKEGGLNSSCPPWVRGAFGSACPGRLQAGRS